MWFSSSPFTPILKIRGSAIHHILKLSDLCRFRSFFQNKNSWSVHWSFPSVVWSLLSLILTSQRVRKLITVVYDQPTDHMKFCVWTHATPENLRQDLANAKRTTEEMVRICVSGCLPRQRGIYVIWPCFKRISRKCVLHLPRLSFTTSRLCWRGNLSRFEILSPPITMEVRDYWSQSTIEPDPRVLRCFKWFCVDGTIN